MRWRSDRGFRVSRRRRAASPESPVQGDGGPGAELLDCVPVEGTRETMSRLLNALIRPIRGRRSLLLARGVVFVLALLVVLAAAFLAAWLAARPGWPGWLTLLAYLVPILIGLLIAQGLYRLDAGLAALVLVLVRADEEEILLPHLAPHLVGTDSLGHDDPCLSRTARIRRARGNRTGDCEEGSFLRRDSRARA